MHRSLRRWLLVALAVTLTVPLSAQRFFGFGIPTPNEYDGRFVLARLWYASYPGWSYDWPDMEENLGKIIREISTIRPHPGLGNIFRMDDPDLLKFPVAYLSEPGYWYPSEAEVLGLRTYLAKGGFLIVDDFHFENEWQVFENAIRRVLPGAVIEPLPLSHPIFHTFFEIQSLRVPYPGQLGAQGLFGEFYGIRDPDHPSHRLKVVINYNMDIGDYMEHSANGLYPVDPTNEAFKFGMNYLIYGLSR